MSEEEGAVTSEEGNQSAATEELSELETFEKMNQHLAHLEALSCNCSTCQKLGLDYRAHLANHTKPSSAQST